MSKHILDKWFDHSMEVETVWYLLWEKVSIVSRVGMAWGRNCHRFYSKNKETFNVRPWGRWSCWDREWGQQVLRAVEREEVTREMKIILVFFLGQKINWASDPKRAFFLGHRVLPIGMAILTSQAGQEFSSNSMEGASWAAGQEQPEIH